MSLSGERGASAIKRFVQQSRVARSLPSWRVFGVTKRMALCRCSPLYHLAKDFTQAWASVLVAKPLVGQSGRFLQVRNRASEQGLSLLTRGRLWEAVIHSFSIVVFSVAPCIGRPLSAARNKGREMQPSARTACLISVASSSDASGS